MVEKLSVQIALEGGAEVERQLKDIGEAGQKTFADIDKSATQVGGFKNLKPEEVTDKLKTMGLEGTAAFDKIQKAVATAVNFEKAVVGVQSVETAFAALGRAAVPVIGGLITGAAAIATAWLGVAKSINEVDAAAAKLGVSFQQFDKLRQGFLQAGISSEAVTSGLQKLKSQLDQMDVERVKNAFNELADAATRGFGAQGTAQLKLLQEAANGVGPAADAARQALVDLGQTSAGEQLGKVTEAFQRLGIQGRTLNEVVPQIVAKLQAMPDSVERTSLAIKLLGDKLGVELVAALRTGSLTAEQFNAAMGNLTREQQIAAAQTQQSINKMDTAWNDFKASVISPIVIPLFDFMKGELAEISKRIATTKQEWAALQSALSAITPKTTIDISLTQSLAPEIDKVNQKLAETEQKAAAASQALQQTGQAGAQGGAQAAAGLQLVANPLTGMPEVINRSNQALAQTGQIGAQAGQQAAAGLQLVANPLTGMPEVIRVTNEALQKTGQTGAQAFGQVGTAADQATIKTIAFKDSNLAITWDNILSAGVSAWNALTGAIQSAIDKLLQFIGLKPGAPQTGGGAPGKASGGLLGGRGTGTSDSNLAWLSRGEYVMPARAVAQPGVLALLEALRRSGGIPGFAGGGLVGKSGIDKRVLLEMIGEEAQSIINHLSDISVKLNSSLFLISATLEKSANSLREIWATTDESLMQVSRQLVNLYAKLGEGSIAALGMASGGLLGGRGTGTSDSNLAWLSRGEHIMPARAVAQPGVLALLEALRRSGGNLSAVLNGMGRFALGGMIPRAMPAFASGGLAGGMSNVTIQFPGLPAIGGLRASSAVVDELHRAAALAQVRSGGRKPSRYS